MDEYKVEFFIANDNEEETELSNLIHKDSEQWRRDLEITALSEYYNRKIKIVNQNYYKSNLGKIKIQSKKI